MIRYFIKFAASKREAAVWKSLPEPKVKRMIERQKDWYGDEWEDRLERQTDEEITRCPARRSYVSVSVDDEETWATVGRLSVERFKSMAQVIRAMVRLEMEIIKRTRG